MSRGARRRHREHKPTLVWSIALEQPSASRPGHERSSGATLQAALQGVSIA
jgi:hypothetical protein